MQKVAGYDPFATQALNIHIPVHRRQIASPQVNMDNYGQQSLAIGLVVQKPFSLDIGQNQLSDEEG